jgi:serine/threonine-protein kinase
MDLPRRIGRYEIRARLAAGATAEVFLARAADGPDVALKRLHPHLGDDADAVAVLLDEARLAARLDHPAAVPVVDLGCEDGAWFVAFEHVAGLDLGALSARLAAQAALLPPPVAVAVAVEIAWALAALHRLEDGRLVHGDVAPRNILVGRDGAVRLTDLGACAALARGAPGVFGTPGYVAPEQARGDRPGPAADVFSTGAILFELLAGVAPYPREALCALAAPLHGAPPALSSRRPELGDALSGAVARALARDARDRFATANALAAALRPFAAPPEEARATLAAAVAEAAGRDT